MKLGKLPAAPRPTDLEFKAYLRGSLPQYPKEFGHETNIGDFGMLGNDKVGDCTIAGAAHEHMIWTTEGFAPTPFSDAGVIADYSAISGYDPTDPSTDIGCDVHDVMAYRKDTGLIDAAGNRHKIAAYLSIDPGNLDHLLLAAYLFGTVGIGIQFPDSAMDQFNNGLPWDYVDGATIEGGHYIPLVARRGNLVVVTWGTTQQMTPTFFTRYCDECWCMVSVDMMLNGKSPEGFNLLQLQEDLNAL